MTPAVIADISGSMLELGKSRILANILRALRFMSPKTEIYSWQENISPLHDIDSIKPEGKNSLSSLYDFMKSSGGKRFLVISDGHFDSSGTLSPSGIIIASVALGADANIYALEKLSGKNLCFTPENIRAAFDSLSYGHDE